MGQLRRRLQDADGAAALHLAAGAFFDLIPAPDLKPEGVKSIELGLRRELPRGYFGVTAFNAEYDNFIQSLYNIPGTSQYTYRNLSEVHVWGSRPRPRGSLATRWR